MVGICKPTLSILDPCFSGFFPAFRHLDIIQTGSKGEFYRRMRVVMCMAAPMTEAGRVLIGTRDQIRMLVLAVFVGDRIQGHAHNCEPVASAFMKFPQMPDLPA